MPEISPSKIVLTQRSNSVRDGVKVCIRCRIELSVDQFGRFAYTTAQGKRSTRISPRCRECDRERRRQRYAENPGRDRQASKDWKRRNSEHLRAKNKERQKDAEVRRMKAAYQRNRKARLKAGSPASKDPRVIALYQQATLEQQKLRLCVASDDPLDLQVHVDHIVPISRGKARLREPAVAWRERKLGKRSTPVVP